MCWNGQDFWKKDIPWLGPVKSNFDGAMCRVSGDTLHVTSSIGVIKTHEKKPKHLNNLEKSKNQLQFVVNKKGSLSLKTVDGGIFLSEEQTWKAEILHVLNVVDKIFFVVICFWKLFIPWNVLWP